MGILLPGSPVLLSLLAPTTDPANSTASTALDALAYVPKQPSQANPLPALISVVVESILEVAILCAVGWFLAKKGIVDAKAKKVSGRGPLNTSLFTPCLLFNKVAFSLTPDKLAELYIIPIGFCLVSAFSAGVAYLLGRVAGLKKGQRDFAIACATFQNSNSLPIALLQSLIGEKLPLAWGPHDTRDGMLGRGLTYLVLYSSLGIIVRWSIGVRLLSSAETQSPTGDTSIERDPERGEAEGPGVREDETDDRENDGLLASSEGDGNGENVRRSILKNGGGARRTRESTASSSTLTPEPSSSTSSNGNGKLVPLPPDADDQGAFSTPQKRRKRTRIFQSFPNTPIPSVYSASSLRSSADSASFDQDEDADGEGDDSLASGWDDEDAEWGARRGFGRRWLSTGSSSPFFTRVKKGTSRAWRKTKRVWAKVADFMTVPLWAAVLSLVVACIPPLQSVLNKAEPVKSAIRSAGSCSVPITLVTLGAYFYRPSAASAADTSPLRREEQELPRSFRSKLLHLVKKPFKPRKNGDGDGEGDGDKAKGETSTVVVAVVSRMVVVPLVLIPLFAWYAKVTVNVADDPVFVVVACLLIGSPTAITLAQITSSAAGPTFEKLISRTLLVSYALLTAPSTIILVLAALWIDGLQHPHT
uniref:BY PROTMAP: gi/472584820/gb/EMS22395.1/ protein of auxin efflux carrier family [Rhodosporidium toruloides NP11] gi/647401045/emb/CDR46984.1/ RHTO0S13e04412g1_1 [Rhodosporidium toruloides] n=1 Tax=Rhodotorula toruloides TaxID=5286 RepID=A0A0K3CW30_RHOTO